MASTNETVIKIKYREQSVASNSPSPQKLAEHEIAYSETDNAIYIGTGADARLINGIWIGNDGTNIPNGAKIWINPDQQYYGDNFPSYTPTEGQIFFKKLQNKI